MSDHIHYGFQYGSVSRSVLGNLNQIYYPNCFVDGINFIGTLQGALVKRPAIKFLFSEEQPNLVDYRIFQAYFKDVSYLFRWVINVNNEVYYRVFLAETGEPVTDEQTIDSFTDLSQLNLAFKNNFGIFTHPSFHPLFYGNEDDPVIAPLLNVPELQLNRYPNIFGPLLDQNVDLDITLRAATNPLVGETTTINSSVPLFEPQHVRSVWAATEAVGNLGSYPIWTQGIVVAINSFYRNDGKVYQAINAGTTGNIPPTHDIDGDIQSDGAVRWLFCNDGTGYFQIITVVSSTEVLVLVQRRLPNTMVTTPTFRWNEAAWSEIRGFPAVTTLFEQKIAFASSTYEPDRIWTTDSGSDFSFFEGANVTTSEQTQSRAFAVPDGGKIEWILGGREFIVGSRRRIQEINALSAATLLSQLRNGVEGGCAGNQAYYIDTLIAYLGVKRRNLRLLIFRDEYQGYSNYNAEFLNPGALSNLSYMCVLTQPKTVLGINPEKNQIEAYQLDLQRAIDGIYSLKNDELKFLSITSDRVQAFIASNNNIDDTIWIGTFDPEEQQSSYIDYGLFGYEASMYFPPISSWTPPVYAGSLKNLSNMVAHIRYYESGTFFFEGSQVNAKRTQDPLGSTILRTGIARIPFATRETGNGPFLKSPAGEACRISTALFSFRSITR